MRLSIETLIINLIILVQLKCTANIIPSNNIQQHPTFMLIYMRYLYVHPLMSYTCTKIQLSFYWRQIHVHMKLCNLPEGFICVKHNYVAHYRPQRSWAKVIFSQACVKNSVHRAEGVCLSTCWDTPPKPGRPPPPREQTPPGPGRHPPGKQTPAYGLRAAGTHPTGMHSCFVEKIAFLFPEKVSILKQQFLH